MEAPCVEDLDAHVRLCGCRYIVGGYPAAEHHSRAGAIGYRGLALVQNAKWPCFFR